MRHNSLFITGTDTDCGKTEVTLALMRHLRAEGLQVLGMKPVASGAQPGAAGLRNADALRIQAAGSLPVPYEWINPYAFEPPIAPHLAAREAGVRMRPERIRERYQALCDAADVVVVEGVGGWRVPLGPDFEVADLPALLESPVLLVVGMRLGCLNHALLSAQGIAHDGAEFAGWIANHLDPEMSMRQANQDTLRQAIAAPMLGALGYLGPGDSGSRPSAGAGAEGFDREAIRGVVGY